MLLVLLLNVWIILGCDVDNNDPVTGLNVDCNYAGTCAEVDNGFLTIKKCRCCAPSQIDASNECGDNWTCDPADPSNQCYEFSSSDCTQLVRYIAVNFAFTMEERNKDYPADIDCFTDPYIRATTNVYNTSNYDFVDQVRHAGKSFGWPGNVKVFEHCDSCSPAYPCSVMVDPDANVTEGQIFMFQIDLNELYDENCTIDGWVTSDNFNQGCEANYDYGQSAYSRYIIASDDGNKALMRDINTLLWEEPSASNSNLGLGWNNTEIISMFETASEVEINGVILTLAPSLSPTNDPTNTPSMPPSPSPTNSPTYSPTLAPTNRPTDSPTLAPTNRPTDSPTPAPTHRPTDSPTPAPTNHPTDSPTPAPTNECAPYFNDVEDMVFKGVGSNCRAGLEDSYTGGKTCSSPYILCLPEENTHAADGFGGEPYKSSTYRYTVDECLQECAYDQRCLGAEFVADTDSALGDCNLIDDIPPVITSEVTGFKYSSDNDYANLDSSVTNGDALCFEKEAECYPYFEADDLNDVMLNCYCPNNRKGYYTKKVKRIVSNTRFCGDDSDVDTRIKKAQANRMFHLCENWCLFQTEDPESECWYYDPWNGCWREQYAGVGAHSSWCNRVIRSPDTIEMQFLNHRSTLFCQTGAPTGSPSAMDFDWFLADEEDSCDDVCTTNGKVCNEAQTAGVTGESSTTDVEGYFDDVGVDCASVETGTVDWALPGYEVSTGICLTRDSLTENTDCSWAIGDGYQRLCACVSNEPDLIIR